MISQPPKTPAVVSLNDLQRMIKRCGGRLIRTYIAEYRPWRRSEQPELDFLFRCKSFADEVEFEARRTGIDTDRGQQYVEYAKRLRAVRTRDLAIIGQALQGYLQADYSASLFIVHPGDLFDRWLESKAFTCKGCGGRFFPLRSLPGGRPADSCSKACKQSAYRRKGRTRPRSDTDLREYAPRPSEPLDRHAEAEHLETHRNLVEASISPSSQTTLSTSHRSRSHP